MIQSHNDLTQFRDYSLNFKRQEQKVFFLFCLVDVNIWYGGSPQGSLLGPFPLTRGTIFKWCESKREKKKKYTDRNISAPNRWNTLQFPRCTRTSSDLTPNWILIFFQGGAARAKGKVATCIQRQKIASVALFRTLAANRPWSFRHRETSTDQVLSYTFDFTRITKRHPLIFRSAVIESEGFWLRDD